MFLIIIYAASNLIIFATGNLSFHEPYTMIAAGDGTLKIDLMKPALYEETFIRSVEYITTITIIMPKKQQQHLISSLSLYVQDRCSEAPFSLYIMMILSDAPGRLSTESSITLMFNSSC